MEKIFSTLKRILQPLSIYSSENPITEEIEKVSLCERHLLLMIKARWLFCAMAVVYGLLTAFICYRNGLLDVVYNLAPPLVGLFFVMLAYNSWYHYSYRHFSHITGLRQAQMLVDVFITLIFIHYTGGVVSWVWVVYPLLVIEAALIFDRPKDIWLISISSIVLYISLLALEFNGVIPQVKWPFYIYKKGYGLKLASIYATWVTFIIICSTLISIYLMQLQRNTSQKLRKRVIRDHLTGLYNRKHFFHALNSELERARRFDHITSLLLIDIDNFKNFNDTFGHLEGDKLLQGITTILQKNIRSGQGQGYDLDMPFRYGGDEFAILLPETTPSSSVKAAERLKSKIAFEGVLKLAERIRRQVEKFPAKITISIGVATYPVHGEDVEGIIRAADEALYKAKQQGRNVVILADHGQP